MLADEADRPSRVRAARSRSPGVSRAVVGTGRALGRALGPALLGDLAYMVLHARLFVGLAFMVVGLLSFTSDYYCDGVGTRMAGCTRPATYYYYPWWAVLLIVLGAFLLTLWLLRARGGERGR